MIRHAAVTCCVICLFASAGFLQEGVTLRSWDEAGTVVPPGREEPWALAIRCGCLVGVGTLAWLAARPGGRTAAGVIAEASAFLAVAGLLAALILGAGAVRARRAVPAPFLLLVAIEFAVAGAGAWAVGRWRRRVGRRAGRIED